jgi:hypothetical protein
MARVQEVKTEILAHTASPDAVTARPRFEGEEV